jgi:hypothetical protein
MATVQTNLGSLQTSISNIGAKVTQIDGNVATITTSLGDLNGTITSIQGDIATIKTDIGIIKITLELLKPNAPAPAANSLWWILAVITTAVPITADAILYIEGYRQKITQQSSKSTARNQR